MANNVSKEFELYEPMRVWLQTYLEEKYIGANVITVDAHAKALDRFLEHYDLMDMYPQTVGLDIQIDVLGVIRTKRSAGLVFIEAKKTQLNLHDLGQLWAYCKLCNPLEAFLLSSVGLGSLNKILNTLNRVDLLAFGERQRIRRMQVGKWDVAKASVDFHNLIPKA